MTTPEASYPENRKMRGAHVVSLHKKRAEVLLRWGLVVGFEGRAICANFFGTNPASGVKKENFHLPASETEALLEVRNTKAPAA